ncbi:MAG: metallophosphoesterase [Desulfobulbaceae bacterium]|nr:metallophosphoesterase [Desulfobulbaceae bacterium]
MKCKNILGVVAIISLILIHSLSWAGGTEQFSFTVFGDSRLPGNMNFSQDQCNIDGPLDQYIRANFMGKTVSDFALSFNKGGKLVKLRVPKDGELYKEITLDTNGWPKKIIDTSKTPSLTLIEEGQVWVYDSVIDSVAGESSEGFVLHTGDISYNGYYGTDPSSVYWAEFKARLLDRLPSGTPKGLVGRFFPAVGNHETWLDPEMKGLRSTVPYLKKLKVTADNHMYTFDYSGSRFIFLDTGGYNPPAGWSDDSKPNYTDQMTQMTIWLAEAQKKNISHVFIALHKPLFCSAGHGHLSADKNPHNILKWFAAAKDHPLDITVFSGHVHSSEMYYKDNIRYMVLGGGGADQVYSVNECAKDDQYCQDELYWAGKKRVMEYNYLTVAVDDYDIFFKMNRWRPQANGFETCIIDKQMNMKCEKSER